MGFSLLPCHDSDLLPFRVLNVPEEIRYEYETLLDLYNPEELEAARAEYGDWAIRSMYESEFGGYYADIPTPDELEDDAPDICIRLKGDRK